MFYTAVRRVRARREYRCDECGDTIQKRELYAYFAMMEHGKATSCRFCLCCDDWWNALAQHAPAIAQSEELWTLAERLAWVRDEVLV